MLHIHVKFICGFSFMDSFSFGILLMTMVKWRKCSELCTAFCGISLDITLLPLTCHWPLHKGKPRHIKWPWLTSSGQESIILLCSWRQENQKYLVNNSNSLPQTLHKPDTVMDARGIHQKWMECVLVLNKLILGKTILYRNIQNVMMKLK